MYNLKTTINIEGNKIQLFKPDICPFCNKGIEPIIVNKFVVDSSNGSTIYIAMKCPVCGEVFFCKYLLGASIYYASSFNICYPVNQIFGGHALTHSFSEEINDLSPNFVKIYNQAYEAEQNGLDEICGIGYRKAFEILVKDLAIYKNPDDSEKILKQSLGQCISSIFNDREKEIFQKTGWIGNDQTHYLKKHESFNVEDLKRMIMICAAKIEAFIREAKYIKQFEQNDKND